MTLENNLKCLMKHCKNKHVTMFSGMLPDTKKRLQSAYSELHSLVQDCKDQDVRGNGLMAVI